ncbi:MAG TPA: hypothetical protein VK779_00130 [Rhizomicrobium sp.]|jgi:hypothetical protein|nr:hypothetical protein [Rhizomicrobium sp.]
MKQLMLLVGALAVCLGLLWIGQGTGHVQWPASSFMIGNMRWTYIGCIVAVIGLGLVAYSQRKT